MSGKDVISMLKAAAADWKEDNAPRLGAALSYYTIFSLAPLLLIAIAIAGLVFGEQAARGQIVAEIGGLLGRTGAEAIQAMLENAREPGSGLVAAVIGAVMLLVGASGAFAELRGALNVVWEAPPPPRRGLLGAVRERLASFAMVLVLGFLLLVSLLISAALTAVGSFAEGHLPGGLLALRSLNGVLSFAVVTVLFAMIFKLLPDVKVAWRDVWAGALMTAALFALGKWALGLYLGKKAVGSAFGAAGSLVAILVWVYYAAQILFFGAELTQVYAKRHGSHAFAVDGPPRVPAGATRSSPAPAADAPRSAPAPAPAVTLVVAVLAWLWPGSGRR
ncbi:MAG TPA: YihY/virulence factor BrkB family protein [Vicinamibacteria bacterium]|nr:YihY/virulence factor BrkB family protein [Vicinamibacteria bacterium]